MRIGKVTSIEKDHKQIECAKQGNSVAIKIDPYEGEENVAFGRHFDATSTIYSNLSRHSIDVLKDNFKNDLSKDEWGLVVKLKGILGIN